eukprot:scaffold9623_cov67-Phaeocystis_antarctica.AAC.5
MHVRQLSQNLFLKCSLPGTKCGGHSAPPLNGAPQQAEHSGERPNPCVSSSKPDNIWPRAVGARAGVMQGPETSGVFSNRLNSATASCTAAGVRATEFRGVTKRIKWHLHNNSGVATSPELRLLPTRTDYRVTVPVISVYHTLCPKRLQQPRRLTGRSRW